MRGGHLAGQAAGCGRLQEAGTDSDRFNLSSSKNQPLSPATETLSRFPGTSQWTYLRRILQTWQNPFMIVASTERNLRRETPEITAGGSRNSRLKRRRDFGKRFYRSYCWRLVPDGQFSSAQDNLRSEGRIWNGAFVAHVCRQMLQSHSVSDMKRSITSKNEENFRRSANPLKCQLAARCHGTVTEASAGNQPDRRPVHAAPVLAAPISVWPRRRRHRLMKRSGQGECCQTELHILCFTKRKSST
ncbi:serrate protein [Culex quinquefasciatus]|uniref:Serrate protein n=1 Tax=Culex quinquefasciatus TaxID=7176 RepID=B0W0I8_CULQU|nr:serrate protein [Culex quinquefasciatus]|eukprot:XP_001842222.1 serrate protein [Culex quinquefasciatus]